MNLQDLGSIGEFVAAIATIATLIYLVQIRRNTEAVRSPTHQQQVDATVVVHSNVANDPEMAKLITRANDDFESLQEDEKLRLMYFYVNYFNMWHFQYTYMKRGLFDRHAWEVWDEGWAHLLQMQRGMREMWAAFGSTYGKQFAAHVEAHLKAIESQNMTAGSAQPLMDARAPDKASEPDA